MQTATNLMRVRTPQGQHIPDVLADAFCDDPMFQFIIPDDSERRRLLPRIFSLNLAYACRYGEVYSTPEGVAAALWVPPGFADITPWRMLQTGMFAAPFRINWRTLGKLLAVTGEMERMHHRFAPTHHWYLSQIGVSPTHQGQGIGSLLLRPMLARLDTEKVPCYLETTKATNVTFYQHHDFTVVAEQKSIKGGPGVWSMVRQPQ